MREIIRSRVSAYNDGVVPKELRFYGVDGNKEWRQYQLAEYGLNTPTRCPFKGLVRKLVDN